MNKGILIAVAVVILLAFGAGAFVLSKKSTQPSTTSNNQTTTQTESAQSKKSLKDLMGLGITQECKFTDQTSASQGVVHTSGNKVHGRFTTTVEGQTMVSNMLSDSETIYIWTEGQAQGMKMTVSSMDDFSDAPDEQKGSVNLNQQVDYSCGVWVVDPTVFEVPTNVEFQDLSAIMEQTQQVVQEAQEADADSETQQCEACDSLPDSAKNSCRQALGC